MKLYCTLLLLATLPFNYFSQVPNYVPSNGLVGWWPFNGNANDESGNGNHGTVNGAALTTDRNGLVNDAYFFNGISNLISIPHTSSIAITGDISISLWKKSMGHTGNYETYVVKRDANSRWNYSLGASHYYGVGGCPGEVNKYLTARRNNASQYDLKFSDSLVTTSDSIWTHVTVVIQNNIVSFYINGIPTGFSCFGDQFNVPSTDFGAPLTFGSWTACTLPEFFHGSLDDIGIWNRALTACEIQDLYQAQLGYTTINAGLDQNVCIGNSVVLQGSGGNFLSWNNGVFVGVPFTPNQTAAYVLTGADTLGCVGVDTVVVTVLETSSSTMNETALDSYTWPVNGQTYTQSGTYTDTLVNAVGCDSIVTLQLTMQYTGIDEQGLWSTWISPNPVKDEFSIVGTEPFLSMNLKDVHGNDVKSFNVQDKTHSLSMLPSGIYFLELSKDSKTFVVKLLKE